MSDLSLKRKTSIGFFWNFIERFFVQFIQFILGIVLARILFPSDLGLIGMMTLFIVMSKLFVDSGLANALIQKQNRTEEDFSTVFYFNVIVCFACYLFIYILAPYISAFYRAPELTGIMRIFFISLIIDSFTSVQITKLRIELNFKKKAICSLTAVIISGSTGVWMACSGFGVWALVMQTIINSLVTLLALTVLVRWRPRLTFSKASFNQLFGFGSKLLGAALIDCIVDNLFVFLIGRYFSKSQVGFFTKGSQMPSVLSGTIMSMFESVTYPVMTSIQNDKNFLINVYRRILRMVSFFVIPAMAGVAFISEPFVRYFLTEKWMPAVVLMQWFCCSRIFTPINLLNTSLLNAVGRSDLFLKINLVRLPVILTILIVTIPNGLEAVVIGLFVMSIIGFFINSFMPGKLFGYGPIKQIKDILPTIVSSAVMVIILAASTFKIEHDLIKMIASFVIGLLSYLLINLMLKREEVNEIRSIIISGYNKIKNR